MNKKDPIIKNKIIESCAKNTILLDTKSHKKNWLLKPYLPNEIIPSNKQLNKWGIYGAMQNKIKEGNLDINDELGLWTPSFCSGIRDSGIFYEIRCHCFKFNKNTHNEFLLDISEIKLPIKISKIYQNQYVNLTGCPFMEYGINNGEYNYTEYLAGLFTGGRIENIEREEWMVVPIKNEPTLNKITTILNKYKILYKIGKKGQILISPFIGALFFGYMPLHSSTRIINIKRAAMGSKLALIYWNMVREIGQPVAPTKAHILPFAVSYATHWNSGILKKTDIRKMGVDMGIIGISSELRQLIKEWISYHS